MSGPDAHPDPNHDFVEQSLARTLFRLGPYSQSMSLFGGLALAIALSPVAQLQYIALWFATLAATAVYRIFLVRRFRAQADDQRSSADLARSIRRYQIAILASGICWGASILLLAPGFPSAYVAVATMVLAGVTAGVATALAAQRGLLMAFSILALTPAALVFFAGGDLLGVMAGILVCIFIAAMMRVERNLHRVLRDNLELTASNAELALRLGVANADLTDQAQGHAARAQRAEARARVLHALHETTSVVGTTVGTRLQEMLRIGCRYFGLPNGIISHISGGTYTVREVVAVEGEPRMRAGDSMALDDAVCAVTFDSDDPIAFAGETQRSYALRDHPAGDLSAFCDAYVGARVPMGGQTYGTMCFYDTEANEFAFEEVDREFVRLMAQWVSRELSEQALQDALKQKADELVLITNSVDAGIAYADSDLILRFANKRYRESLDPGQKDAIGRHLREILGSGRFETIAGHLERCLRGEPVRYKVEREVHDGRRVVRDVSLVPDLGGGGEIRGIFALVYDVTEVWNLQAKLDAKVQELELITDSVTAGIGYTDGDLVFRFINRTYLERLGKREDEVIGQHLRDVIGDESFAEIEPLVQRCLKGERVNYQAERDDPAGDRVFRDVNLVPDIGADGSVSGIFAMVYDITAERLLQEALDEKVKQLRTITDSVAAGIGYLDRELRFVFANEYYATLLGWEGRTVTGLNVAEVLGDEYYKDVRGYLQRVIAGEAVTYEATREYTPGRQSHLQVAIEPDLHGETVLGMFVFVTDITEFRETERALAAETDLAETTLDSISEAVVRINSDGVVDFINPSAESLIGLRADLARGRALSEVLPLVFGDGRQLAPMVMRQIVGRRARFEPEEELWLKRPGDHGGSWVRCLAVPLHGGPDGIGEGLLMLRDVTSMRREIQELAHRASHDTLTGLYNRREIERQLGRAVEEAVAGSDPFALIFMDLDGFKDVNDALGHLAGDQLLAQIAEGMRSVMRQEDVLARIGGDEFAVLARNCSLPAAQAIAEKLRLAVKNTSLTWDGSVYRVGMSIGIAPVGPESTDVRSVLNLADQACYAAKRAGKDRIELATPDGPVH